MEIDERIDNKSDLIANHNNDYDSYIDLLKEKDSMVKNGMADTFSIQKEYYLKRLQESYLKSHAINYKDLVNLFHSYFQRNKDYVQDPKFQSIWKAMENLTTMSFNTIALGGAPIAEGEKTIFKQRLRENLDEFKSKHKLLFPLIYPIGITVFYTPPVRNAIDLDNLARLIIPALIELFDPPPTVENSIEIGKILPGLKDLTKTNQRLPKNAITNYQIVNRPRKMDSPEAGKIDLFITDGMDFHYNLWNQIDDINEYVE
ncbi:hypothetical protein EZV76_16700 [Flagellimonas alvinocaridis]|uniref:Uncharacterized protein n=1 Tax=Flagellimonas alvinocaridis TaxID=2530200 RepID=A0A4S8RSC8_9FLAO|nr:hypothetical protein [Allomuricauda alvinocaridis]THV56794.1 hypothetical protein EZV76_16700 [Allomuricauda alvinocaridis]